MYAAYRNYLYQLETRPHMRNLLEQKAQEQVQALKAKPTEGTEPQSPQRFRRGPSSGGPPRSILRRSDTAKRSDRFPKHVLDAVMAIQQHIDQSDDAPWDGTRASPESGGALRQASDAFDQSGHGRHAHFASSVQSNQRDSDDSSTDSANSKNE